MQGNIYLYIFIMAGVTYLIRLLPLLIFRREIKNRFVRSFLYYIPYVTLSVMTVPAIFSATGNVISSAVGFAVAVLCAWFDGNLFRVSLISCGAALAASYIVQFLNIAI